MFQDTLPDRLWEKISRLLPRMKKKKGKAGRPPTEWREILDAIFFVLQTGIQWKALPKNYPPKSTVYDRFTFLVQTGFFERMVRELSKELLEAGILDLEECFIDGTFVRARCGGEAIAKTKCGKGSKIMAISARESIPVGIEVTSAAPHESQLVEATIKTRFTKQKPRLLIGDGAYDSDPLDEKLEKQNVTLIAPHRANRVKPKTQDGRVFRRYSRRWFIERFNAWLHNFRRVANRYEKKLIRYKSFVQFACAVILNYFL